MGMSEKFDAEIGKNFGTVITQSQISNTAMGQERVETKLYERFLDG